MHPDVYVFHHDMGLQRLECHVAAGPEAFQSAHLRVRIS